MDAEQIEAIKDMLEKAFPRPSTVSGYKYDPQYCGEYEGKLVFYLNRVPPKACPDSPMYVGYPYFALVDLENPEQFEVVLDHDLKFLDMFYCQDNKE